MSQNIPIRLIHQNGNITEILATDVALDVERKTGGIPIPFAGGTRGGFDFNLNNATIIINGIISDDDVISTYSTSSAASATIDFSVSSTSARTESAITSWITLNQYANELTLLGDTRVTASNTEDTNVLLTLHDANGDDYQVAFVSVDGAVANHQGKDTGPDPDRYYIGIYRHTGGSETKGTHVEIADNLFDLINNDSILQTKFTATKETSPLTGEANTVVRITQVTTGSKGNQLSPIIGGRSRNRAGLPYIRRFAGGRGKSGSSDDALSAGDKVMNLYGILNNSDNATLWSRVQAMGNPFNSGNATTKWDGNNQSIGSGEGGQFGDYITGIQIPYNSIAMAEAGEKYSVRNFFMPTGATRHTGDKGTENSQPATVKFDPDTADGDYTGIKGTVQKATFTQLGGEPIWSFTIIFAPIDLIW